MYGFSLAYSSHQHHYSCPLGSFWSRIRVTWAQTLWYHHRPPDNQVSYQATTRRRASKHGDAPQRGDSPLARVCSRFHHATQKGKLFKTYTLFISFIFHLIFLNHGWLQVTETAESKTTSKEGLLYLGEARKWLLLHLKYYKNKLKPDVQKCLVSQVLRSTSSILYSCYCRVWERRIYLSATEDKKKNLSKI